VPSILILLLLLTVSIPSYKTLPLPDLLKVDRLEVPALAFKSRRMRCKNSGGLLRDRGAHNNALEKFFHLWRDLQLIWKVDSKFNKE